MWPFLRENHQAFTSFSPFIPHKILFRVLQCLPGGEGAWGEFEETLSSSENPWNGFLFVVGIPGDYSTIMWWQWFCLGRQHFRLVREFWCLNKPVKTQYQNCWGVSSSICQDQDVTQKLRGCSVMRVWWTTTLWSLRRVKYTPVLTCSDGWESENSIPYSLWHS